MVFWNILLSGSLVLIAEASLRAAVKRQVSQLRPSYDFIVAGGGTTGLTVADRLTETFPEKTVLVVEYGEVEYAPGIFDPPQTVWGGGEALARSFLFQSLPNVEVKNKTATVFAGRLVGGSSGVNGMFFDRGSRFDYDAWMDAGSPEFDSNEHKWNWDELFPFFKKSVTFTEPPNEVVKKYGYTWNLTAFGGTTPIYSSFPPFLWGDHFVVRDTWKDMGIRVAEECAGGDKEGLCWVPISQHPVTARRSHAGLGHYVARPNYDLLVNHQVTRVMYPDGPSNGPPVVQIVSLGGAQVVNATAKAEVIIAAGAFHSPAILQRSGIGPASFLEKAGIPLVLDLPGVGSNLQDHSGPGISWNYTTPGNFSPAPTNMFDPTFAAAASAQFDEVPARGPYTLAMSNSAIFISLPNITVEYMTIIDRIREMVEGGSAASYLPVDYNSDPALIAGYNHQLSVLANLLKNPKAPSIEVPFATGTSVRLCLLHPMSRGTVRLDLENHLRQPILDYRTASNPVDFDIHLAHVKYLRKMIGTDTMRKYGAIEVAPGSSIQSDAALMDYIKDSMTFSFMHPCCTAAMMPKSKGGVVGPDLRVHGAAGLRVVDMSVLPLLPSAHLSATAYAVGEKAADIIIKRWS
jgi:choline dehydrogenase-like flavoprotein